VLELTNDAYTKLSADAYLMLAKRMPWLLGWVYDVNDVPFTNEQPLRKLWDMLNTQPVVRFVKDYRPDICVCTHFTPAGIISQLMVTNQLDTSLSVVTTDYDFQGLWLSQTFNRYFVAREESKARLIDLGVRAERITVSGIPVRPEFGEPLDRDALLARYELRPELPVIVVSAGAVGGGPAQGIVAQLMKMQHDVQCVVVCGTNQRLLHEVEELTLPQASRFRVLGFTRDMVNLIRLATLFVGKPGGLTASECMAAGTPMVIVTPIPGQEERNSDYLLEEGAAVRCNDIETVDYKIDRLLGNPERLEWLRANARRLGRPDAAQVIAATTLADSQEPVQLDWRAQLETIRPAPTTALPRLPWDLGPGMVTLYDDQRGVYLGSITSEQFRKLRRYLRDRDTKAETATIDHEHIERLRSLDVEPQVCEGIASRIAVYGPLRVRYSRVSGRNEPETSLSR
jgi:processive 1,2-diacylglycerol beta-glucosyltransferase